MSSNKSTAYYVIFDTNTLFQSYEKKADFTKFTFNTTYANVVDMINQLDIYEKVTLVIPSVVWREMERQIIEKHDELITIYKSTITKRLFPEYSISENPLENYSEYIKPQIETYKDELSKGINKVIELPIATSTRFESIVDRAFKKQPPFEGKDKKSDKGFKDALLWESILEFVSMHTPSSIIYYSRDNVFGDYLSAEFKEIYTESSLFICKDEASVKAQLEVWAKEIDKYSYQPISDFNENSALIDWLNSGDFEIQIFNPAFGIVEQNHLFVSTAIHLISIDGIELIEENDNERKYSVDIVLAVGYTLKDGSHTEETIAANLQINCVDDADFWVQNICRTDAFENESEAYQ